MKFQVSSWQFQEDERKEAAASQAGTFVPKGPLDEWLVSRS
jgi:hypothetical protein